jgi:8-oxo-dGTP pyrophosphatase MutT (NUDIX family)
MVNRQINELSVECKQITEQLFHLSVKAIIKNINGDILLLRRPDHQHWDLPGGRINVEENPRDALVREVYEETGLSSLEQIQAHDIELQSGVLSPKLIAQKIKLWL